MDPASSWIDLVLARSLELRRAGVLSIEFDGRGVTLSAYTEPFVDEKATGTPVADFAGDVMTDPASYAGGVVPGYEITKFPADFEE